MLNTQDPEAADTDQTPQPEAVAHPRLVRLLAFMERENKESVAPEFTLRIEVSRRGWIATIADSLDEYGATSDDLAAALWTALHLCREAWMTEAAREKDPDIRKNMQATAAEMSRMLDEPDRQRTALDDLCQWLATEAFGDQCDRLAAEHAWKKERYHAGRAEAFTEMLAKVRELFGPSGQANAFVACAMCESVSVRPGSACESCGTIAPAKS